MRLTFKQFLDEGGCVFDGWPGLNAKLNGNAKTLSSCSFVFAAEYRMHEVLGETVLGGPLPNRCS